MMYKDMLMSSMQISTKFNYRHGNGIRNVIQAKPRKLSALVKNVNHAIIKLYWAMC